jgi:diadenosine tetraphosphatase ApaH/serine/threonine PP2A family protein phosphatase
VRYLVISDIHGNLEALDAVIGAMTPLGFDRALVLGDLVGYGADPNAVVDRIRAMNPLMVIRGNHDKVAAGLDDGESFNLIARSAVQWTTDALTPANLEYLRTLPAGPTAIDDYVQICHGSPFDEDAYIFDELDARHAFDAATAPVCFYGHTHFAVVFRLIKDSLDIVGPPDGETALTIEPNAKYLVNPGSVGQPRDGDPRAAYAIYDTATKRVDLIRLPYPLELTQQKMLKVGLPEPLARRLALGR